MSDDDKGPVKPASLCATHRWLLVSQTGFRPSDPWMALEIVTQVALFQACTTDDKIWAKLEGNLHRLPEIGCMACAKPDSFGEIVQVAADADLKNGALDAIKKLGESWIAAARKDPA